MTAALLLLRLGSMPHLQDCVVLHGPDLEPHHCRRLAWEADTLTACEIGPPAPRLEGAGALVVLPGLVNGHTHLGDSAFPDGATGLTLQQGFFRPDGYKYRQLATLTAEEHHKHLVAHLHYAARTGTVAHLDFREQGAEGARRLRAAADATGVHSVILAQFTGVPFDRAALDRNADPLPADAAAELASILEVGDGFSESTMNDLTDPAWRQIRAATEAAGKLRAIHCLEDTTYRAESLARTGRGDLERALELYAPHLIVHLTVADPGEIARLRAAGTAAVLNPRANTALGLPVPPIAALLDAGVPLLLGTDNGMLNSPNLWPELDFTWKLARSQYGDCLRPDPTDVLRLVTTHPGRVLGPDFPGWLGVGQPATFVVVDARAGHLRHSRHLVASLLGRVTPADVVATVRHGRTLWADPQGPLAP